MAQISFTYIKILTLYNIIVKKTLFIVINRTLFASILDNFMAK